MIIAKIHNIYHSLTKAEKKIADYIFENTSEVKHLTAKELAERCNTAPSAVIRFCKTVGEEGFTSLKIKLAEELGRKNEQEAKMLSENASNNEIVFRKVFDSGVKILKDTISMMKYDQIETICQKIYHAERIFVFGVVTSAVMAMDIASRLSQVGFPAYAHTDLTFMKAFASNMTKGDVAILISHSGKTVEIVDALKQAKAIGAETIAITSYETSIIGQESDYSIVVYPDEEKYPTRVVSSRVAMLCAIDALTMCLVMMKHEEKNEK